MEKPITVGCLEDSDWLLHRYIEINFSKLMDGNQISRNDLFAFIIISVKFQVKLMSANFFLPMISCNELSITLGRVDDSSFFEYLSPFCFLSIEFHVLFSFFIKYYHILFIILVFRFGCDKIVSCFFYCLSQVICHGMRLLACGRVDDFSFLIIPVHFVFC